MHCSHSAEAISHRQYGVTDGAQGARTKRSLVAAAAAGMAVTLVALVAGASSATARPSGGQVVLQMHTQLQLQTSMLEQTQVGILWGRAAVEGVSPTSPRAHWIGPEVCGQEFKRLCNGLF